MTSNLYNEDYLDGNSSIDLYLAVFKPAFNIMLIERVIGCRPNVTTLKRQRNRISRWYKEGASADT